MKNLFIALLLLVVSFAAQAETNWVIAHTGRNTATIYAVEANSQNVYVSTYNVENPTTSMLQGIGLPNYLWPQLAEDSGIFDTRLVEVTNEKNIADQEIDDLREELREEHGTTVALSVLLAISVLGFFILLLAYINKR